MIARIGTGIRELIVEYALQRWLARNNDLAAHLSLRLNAFRPLPFNPAMDAQRIYWDSLGHPHLLALTE